MADQLPSRHVTTKCPACGKDADWFGVFVMAGSGTRYRSFTGCDCDDLYDVPDEMA